MPEVFQKKTALVISGGGSKGAFAVGAIEHLVRDRGLRFDLVAGTSTGALICPLVVTGDIERLKQVYTDLSTDQVLTPLPFTEAFVKFDSLFNSDPALKLIGDDLTPERTRQIFDSDKQMFITTVNLNTGKTVFFHTGPPAVNNDPPFRSRLVRVSNRDALIRAILASGTEPVFMPPITVAPDRQTGVFDPLVDDPGATIKPEDRYVDGGVRDIAPIKIAIDNKATDIYAIVLSSRDRNRNEDPYTQLLNILQRTIGIFTQEIAYKDVMLASLFNQGALYQQALIEKLKELLPGDEATINRAFEAVAGQNPFKGTQVVNLFVIRPEEDLAGTSLVFEPGVMSERFRLGRRQARRVLDAGPNVFPPPAGP